MLLRFLDEYFFFEKMCLFWCSYLKMSFRILMLVVASSIENASRITGPLYFIFFRALAVSLKFMSPLPTGRCMSGLFFWPSIMWTSFIFFASLVMNSVCV